MDRMDCLLMSLVTGDTVDLFETEDFGEKSVISPMSSNLTGEVLIMRAKGQIERPTVFKRNYNVALTLTQAI